MSEFIVAEISKSWTASDVAGFFGPKDFIRQKFEECIEFNRQRGYELHSFQLHRVLDAPGHLNETIIAVFRLVDAGRAAK